MKLDEISEMLRQQTEETKQDYACAKCRQLLRKVPVGIGPFDFLSPTIFACYNNECEHFGVLTIAAMKMRKEEEPKQ